MPEWYRENVYYCNERRPNVCCSIPKCYCLNSQMHTRCLESWYIFTNKEKHGDKYLPLPRLCELLGIPFKHSRRKVAEMWGLASNRSYLLTKTRLKTKPPSLGWAAHPLRPSEAGLQVEGGANCLAMLVGGVAALLKLHSLHTGQCILCPASLLANVPVVQINAWKRSRECTDATLPDLDQTGGQGSSLCTCTKNLVFCIEF